MSGKGSSHLFKIFDAPIGVEIPIITQKISQVWGLPRFGSMVGELWRQRAILMLYYNDCDNNIIGYFKYRHFFFFCMFLVVILKLMDQYIMLTNSPGVKYPEW